jgi:hypothetical protein
MRVGHRVTREDQVRISALIRDRAQLAIQSWALEKVTIRAEMQAKHAFKAGACAGWLAGLLFFLLLTWADRAGVL